MVRCPFVRSATRTDSTPASFLSPPSDPLVANLEREIFLLAFVSAAWGYVLCSLYSCLADPYPSWSCLGIWLASLTRSEIIVTATNEDIWSGRYVEAAVSSCVVYRHASCSI